ncbi:hypothetical protein HanXRQr2_Chr08g0351321 [Helianthus annuus]|uniref:Uncharacterized protein n=1 Tax=Helianthus annuus TaxID=4232 RepID=A0A9K3IH31_HELAN|nr:hypothetical protein HanXRQr2_Chr08g0351321 [Helianthus annuus]KAJ0902635.1 hypothetical protein HanPSC8_Chr08g0339341 [Helianthus annuus]
MQKVTLSSIIHSLTKTKRLHYSYKPKASFLFHKNHACENRSTQRRNNLAYT